MNYNFNEWLKDDNVEITVKKSALQSPEDAKFKRFKERLILVTGLCIIIVFFITTMLFLIKNPSNSLAMNAAFAIATGFIGYILRGKS